MNEITLIKKVASKEGIDKAIVDRIVQSFKDEMIESLKSGETVRMQNFMTFKPFIRTPRKFKDNIRNKVRMSKLKVAIRLTVSVKLLRKLNKALLKEDKSITQDISEMTGLDLDL